MSGSFEKELFKSVFKKVYQNYPNTDLSSLVLLATEVYKKELLKSRIKEILNDLQSNTFKKDEAHEEIMMRQTKDILNIIRNRMAKKKRKNK